MKTVSTIILTLAFYANVYSQSNWELPLVNNKIQFEFNSKKLNSGKQTPCEIYTSMNFMQDLMKQLNNAMYNGSVKFWSATSFTLTPQLYAADMSVGGDMSKYAKPMCGKGDDTLIGSLLINISQMKVIGASRSGNIKCMYRIILQDDSYNIKLRGFKYTFMTKTGQMMTKDLEEEYNEYKAKKADKDFWSDIKMLVGLYHTTLENVMASQGSDLNFDD